MFKKLFMIMKKFIISSLLIYSFDVVAVSMNCMIPINFFTVLLVCLFDIPGLMCLVMFSFMM